MPPRKTPANGRSQADLAYYDNVESIRASLEEIAKLARFIRVYTPYLVAALGVLWPTAGKVVDAIGQAHGIH